jgi:predicted small metal-binding protein
MLGEEEKYKRNMKSKAGRKGRFSADIFVNMIQFNENEWNFDKNDPKFQKIKVLYDTLVNYGTVQKLRGIIKNILDLRNGFDHCWTSAGPKKRELLEEVQVHAENCHKILAQIIGELRKNQIIYE